MSCPIEELLRTCDRVILQGWKDQRTGRIKWIMDLITEDREGHGSTDSLAESVKIAATQVDANRCGDCAAVMVD